MQWLNGDFSVCKVLKVHHHFPFSLYVSYSFEIFRAEMQLFPLQMLRGDILGGAAGQSKGVNAHTLAHLCGFPALSSMGDI